MEFLFLFNFVVKWVVCCEGKFTWPFQCNQLAHFGGGEAFWG